MATGDGVEPARIRRILHVDMDAFYASVEQRDDATLRGRPVVVGGSPQSRGVVCAASYEARVFGVRSAMSCAEAARRCPDAVFVRPDFTRYREVSRKVREIFLRVTDQVEPLSLDEAYLDVTDNLLDEPSGTRVAQAIRRWIHDELGLTASAGVAPVKFVAKIASDFDKPDGLTVVPPERVLAFIHPLPIERLWGVGPKSAARLHDGGVHTIGDVAALDPVDCAQRFGRLGRWIWRLSQGDDPRPVVSDRRRKSRGSEQTFAEDVAELDHLDEVMESQAAEICESLARSGHRGRTVTVKVRYADFTTVTRSHTLDPATDDPGLVHRTARELLRRTDAGDRPVRLVGVSLSSLVAPGEGFQLALPFG